MKKPSQVISAVFPSKDPNTSDEWYTPDYIMESVREVMGFIDLDPASCTEANRVVKANRFFTLGDDGLSQNWLAETVWLNPPRGTVERQSIQYIWCKRLIAHYTRGEIKREAMFIVRAVIGYDWFETIWDKCPNICFLRARPAYYRGFVGEESGQDQLTGAIFYLGETPEKFQQQFRDHGRVFDKHSYR